MATSPINRELLSSGWYWGVWGVLGGTNDTAQYWEILKRYFSVHNYSVQVPCSSV